MPWEAFLGLEGVRLAANGSRSYHFGSIFDGFGMDFRGRNHSGIHVIFLSDFLIDFRWVQA